MPSRDQKKQLDFDALLDKLDKLQSAFERMEKSLLSCQNLPSKNTDSLIELNAWEEFKSIFTKQYVGLSLGVIMGLIFRFFDQKLASKFAKKYNIKQIEVMKSAFPTFICLVQFLLRSRSKNSKLAALLSIFKKKANDEQPEPTNGNTSQSHSNCTCSNTPPKPLSSLSSAETDYDNVFSSSVAPKPKLTKRSKSQSVSAQFKKNSNVILKMESK